MPRSSRTTHGDSDDDAPPEAVSLSVGRDTALQRRTAELQTSMNSSTKKQVKAVAERQQQLVRADLRSADLLLPELLADLPSEPELRQTRSAAAASAEAVPPKRTWPAPKSAAARRAAAAADRRALGVFQIVDTRGNVEIAVAPGKGERRAIVQESVAAFAADALLGKGRVKRAPAISITSLKPSVGRSGTRFAAAKNYATAPPLDPSAHPSGPSKASRRRKRRSQPVEVSAMPTALDRRAAKLMRG